MPGAASLVAHEYYAHPRNDFWVVMEQVLGIPRSLAYQERIGLLRGRGIALWDVLHACKRTSSLDSDIVAGTLVTNDFRALFSSSHLLQHIYFNGSKAEAIYQRHVLPFLDARYQAIPRSRLPSTSPANARMHLQQKISAWTLIAEE